MRQNHRNSNKSKTDTLNEHDIQQLYIWINGWRGDPADREKYVNIGYTPMPKKFRFTTTRVVRGICLDCNKQRCTVCNGCPTDIFNEDLETTHCQICMCLPFEESKPLNETGVPLDILVRKRQGPKSKKKGDLQSCK